MWPLLVMFKVKSRNTTESLRSLQIFWIDSNHLLLHQSRCRTCHRWSVWGSWGIMWMRRGCSVLCEGRIPELRRSRRMEFPWSCRFIGASLWRQSWTRSFSLRFPGVWSGVLWYFFWNVVPVSLHLDLYRVYSDIWLDVFVHGCGDRCEERCIGW